MGRSAKRVAVIGTGYWGKNLVRNFHSLDALSVICDSDPDVAQSLAHSLKGVQVIQSPDQIWKNSKIDGVAIATPAETHADLVRAALDAGKDVLVEKPLCLSEADGRRLIDLADIKERVLMVGHLLWFHPVVLKLKELLSSGELGGVRYIYSNRLNMGKLRREENVLWSFAPHDVSVILGLLGDEPESVQASGGNYLHQKIADTTVSLLEFSSGVKAHIFVSWLHPFKEQKLVVVGDRKMAVFDDTAPWPEKLQLFSHSVQWNGSVPVARKADAELVEVEETEPLKEECRHFIERMNDRNRPRTDGREGLRVLRVLNACQRAIESGKEVRLDGGFSGVFVHDTSVVDPGAQIGEGTKIWHFSHVLSGSKIGRSCNIGQNVVIGPDVRIGDGCKIQNNVSLYKGVTLEDDVFCGPSMVFTNVYNPRSEINRKDEFMPTLVKRGATIGANATIICGVTLGEYSFIGAGAVVTKDVPAFALVVGNPGRQIGWVSRSGERLDKNLKCPVSGVQYRETETGLEEITA